MAYDEQLAARISNILTAKKAKFYEKKMFSGVCYMVNDKMCCGTHIDKKTGENLLLCRVDEATYEVEIEKNEVIPMNFTGKPMKGFFYVTEDGLTNDKKLAYWIQLCLDFNPKAKATKKK